MTPHNQFFAGTHVISGVTLFKTSVTVADKG